MSCFTYIVTTIKFLHVYRQVCTIFFLISIIFLEGSCALMQEEERRNKTYHLQYSVSLESNAKTVSYCPFETRITSGRSKIL